MITKPKGKSLSISDIEHAYYSKSEKCTIDAIHPETGLTVYGNKTRDQVRERYPDAEKLSMDAIVKVHENMHRSEPVEISVKDFRDMLSELPPLKWTHEEGIEIFMMPEFLTGSITGIYIKFDTGYANIYGPLEKKCFCFNDSAFLNRNEIIKKVLDHITK